MTDQLQELREQIQAIDADLVRIMQKRIEIVLKIGLYKEKYGIAVRDQSREEQVIEHVLSLPHEPMDSLALKNLFKYIMKICRDSQHLLMGHSDHNFEEADF